MKRIDYSEDERDLTGGRRHFRRNLQDQQRDKETKRTITVKRGGKYLTLKEWEEEYGD